MAVADVFDALCSRRPYKPAYPFDASLGIIINDSGGQFDPRLCEALVSASSRIRKLYGQ
jgi:Response regulator containing a CheY-like receiver domain and an HD-GYP domain